MIAAMQILRPATDDVESAEFVNELRESLRAGSQAFSISIGYRSTYKLAKRVKSPLSRLESPRS